MCALTCQGELRAIATDNNIQQNTNKRKTAEGIEARSSRNTRGSRHLLTPTFAVSHDEQEQKRLEGIMSLLELQVVGCMMAWTLRTASSLGASCIRSNASCSWQ